MPPIASTTPRTIRSNAISRKIRRLLGGSCASVTSSELRSSRQSVEDDPRARDSRARLPRPRFSRAYTRWWLCGDGDGRVVAGSIADRRVLEVVVPTNELAAANLETDQVAQHVIRRRQRRFVAGVDTERPTSPARPGRRCGHAPQRDHSAGKRPGRSESTFQPPRPAKDCLR